MAVDVLLQEGVGKILEVINYPFDTPNHRLCPEWRDPDFPLLAYIDPYGDTVFNPLQMEPFLAEWRCLYPKAETLSEQKFLQDVERLALRCQNEIDLYLKFFGD